MSIYIPQKIRVGYQEREDTFTKKLAYVIYYDNFGKLRKQTSWERWRSKDIEPQEFDNEPTSGFVLNKGHTRYNWSSFGHSKTVRIRIYDPRGIEFEITAENLVAVLMHTDCSRREITGELVYAWNGTELMLLPVTSEEYQSARKFTALQAKKFSAKDLVEGATYLTKSEHKVVYLGRFDWWEWKYKYEDGGAHYRRFRKRQHVFACDGRMGSWASYECVGDNYFKPLNPSSVIAVEVTREPPENFAELVDLFTKKTEVASEIVKYSVNESDKEYHHAYTIDSNGDALEWHLNGRHYWRHGRSKWTVQNRHTTDTRISYGYDGAMPQDDRPRGLGKLVTHYANGLVK